MEEIKKRRTIHARRLTRKTNELYNAIKGEVHIIDIREKIGALKYCIEELGGVHDEYIENVDPEEKDTLAAEEKWYTKYDVATNDAIKSARDYIELTEATNETTEKCKHVRLKKLEIPKFEGDPKDYYKWKSIYERYTKEYDDETKYDYLLNSMMGEARRYVENKATYDEAIIRLDEKYGNMNC